MDNTVANLTLYGKSKETSKILTCDKCNKEWLLDETDIKMDSMEISTSKRTEYIDITYFTCPNCGEVYVCSLSNAEIKGLLKALKSANNRVRKATIKGDKPTEKQIERVIKLRKQLVHKQAQLNRLYSGKFYQKVQQ